MSLRVVLGDSSFLGGHESADAAITKRASFLRCDCQVPFSTIRSMALYQWDPIKIKDAERYGLSPSYSMD